jgi:hypothetical protein
VLDDEGRHDVPAVQAVASRRPVEVGLRRIGHLVPPGVLVADRNGVAARRVAVRRHGGQHGEHGEQESGGESDDVTA